MEFTPSGENIFTRGFLFKTEVPVNGMSKHCSALLNLYVLHNAHCIHRLVLLLHSSITAVQSFSRLVPISGSECLSTARSTQAMTSCHKSFNNKCLDKFCIEYLYAIQKFGRHCFSTIVSLPSNCSAVDPIPPPRPPAPPPPPPKLPSSLAEHMGVRKNRFNGFLILMMHHMLSALNRNYSIFVT